jgi:ribosomal protein S18 acetylase RimI-like enzyme
LQTPVAERRDVTTRPALAPDDDAFLLALYASTRRAEIARFGWPEAAQDSFIRMQFEAQSRYYRQTFPDAHYCVICLGGERVGRLIVDRRGDEMHIVDIALRPECRGRGVGGGLIRQLLAEADAGHLSVSLNVLKGSAACRFWERAGFTSRGGDDVYLAMERACEA